MPKALLSVNLFALALTLALCACTPQPTYRVEFPYVRDARQYAARGLEYLKHGDIVMAQEYLDTAMQLAPKDPLILDALAFFDEKTGYIGRANRLFYQAMLMDPHSTVLRDNYGAFLCRNGYSQRSIAYFMKSSQVQYSHTAHPVHTNAHYCAEKLGDREEYAYYTRILWKPISKQVTQ